MHLRRRPFREQHVRAVYVIGRHLELDNVSTYVIGCLWGISHHSDLFLWD